ncbi:CHASE3 domain-containing protein [Rhodopila sp.]|uniref:CHASE3 domain-containing protein n=1 Tax=Rhodopila sp. TaxID=2480087 RepID=UPI003D0B26FA
MSRYIVARANSLVFAGLVTILVLIGGAIWDRFNASSSARDWTEHTYAVLGTIKDLNLAVRAAESGERGFLLTGGDDYLAPYNAALDRVGLLEGDLQHQTADNPAQQTRLHTLIPALQHKLEEMGQAVEARREAGLDGALGIVRSGAGRGMMRAIEATLDAMNAEEQRLLAQRQAAMEARGAWIRGLVLSGGILAIAALAWAARLLNQAWLRSSQVETEQRTLALRLRTSFDSLSQGVAVFSTDGRLTHWNECFQILLDLPRAMARVDTPYVAFVEQTAEGGAALLETEQQIRYGRSLPGQPVTYERTCSNGRHLEIRRTPMPDAGFVLTVADMTKRAQAEAVLREAQKMQAIGQLTGGIAHDFNNLLTVILGNLELARTKLDSEHPLQIRIERAVWAAQRGATLTSQLLAFARKQPLAPAPVDLTATVPDMVPLLRRTLGEHIDVRYVETAGLWPAMADAAQLENVVLNLALNARDAMPGGGRLTIELANKVLDDTYARHHAEVTPGDYAMLAVSDTGHGMTPDVLACAFEPFFTTKPDGKGTGLGLAMVFGFIKQSQGHVNIYSEPGEGTTVRLYLPRAVGAVMTAAQRNEAPIDLPRSSATVLVVEDEPAVREIAVAILSDLGYHVLEAADGEEGLRVFGAHASEVNLLLTDVVLPGKVRGREIAERIAAIRPEVKVLFMSGYTENSIVHHGRLDDGVQLIGKPFKREQLARKVAEVLGLSATLGVSDTGNVVALKPR